jgi:tellurite resistance protein TerC
VRQSPRRSEGREHWDECSASSRACGIDRSRIKDGHYETTQRPAVCAVPRNEQHRVLFWGVLGALVMRAAFIFAGGAFLQRFHWAMYVFGALLLITGVRLLMSKHHEESHPENSAVLRFFSRVMPATTEFAGDRFTLVKEGKRYATPLLLALIAIEISDLVFALDSIPAIFAVTTDPFLVFTSNIFAILGLRSLYFVLADVVDRFVYLKPALACVLIFVGVKMCIVDFYKVPIPLSLGAIIGILVIAILASMWRRKHPSERDRRELTSTL